MLSEKTTGIGKSILIGLNIALLSVISGCGHSIQSETAATETMAECRTTPQDEDKITEICLPLYQKAAAENKVADPETIRSIITRFGEYGCPSVDSRNQFDMAKADQVLQFCKMVDGRKKAAITIIEVNDTGGFAVYDLQTEGGNVYVVRTLYRYEHGAMHRIAAGKYQAEHWDYTEDGYLMFSGVWFSDEKYVLMLSGNEEYTALRVQPLDETCRELNRKYVLPVGYAQNNMFLTEWSEESFGELDFYDIFDVFYPKINGGYFPYTAGENLRTGAVYRIPAITFENSIMTYFRIDNKTLQAKAIYDPTDAVYEYRPRGFYEAGCTACPYPEVTGFAENSDGTVTLTVHVVFPRTGDSSVYVHELTVRPLENGGVQYVSNRIVSAEINCEIPWYTPRLTQEEWQERYGGRA